MSPFPSVAILLLAVTGSTVCAQPGQSDASVPPVEQLKQTYLHCDRSASRAVLDGATAARCSVVAEALRQHGFGGDFELLLSWWRGARLTLASDPAASPPVSVR